MEEVQGWRNYFTSSAATTYQFPRNKTYAGVRQVNTTEGLMFYNRSFLQFMFFLQVLEYLSRGLVIAGSVRSSLGADFNFGCRDGRADPGACSGRGPSCPTAVAGRSR